MPKHCKCCGRPMPTDPDNFPPETLFIRVESCQGPHYWHETNKHLRYWRAVTHLWKSHKDCDEWPLNYRGEPLNSRSFDLIYECRLVKGRPEDKEQTPEGK